MARTPESRDPEPPKFCLMECWQCEHAWWAEVTTFDVQVVACPACGTENCT